MTTLALPELFGDRFAALEEQFLASTTGDLFADCFGCGPEHPIGLRVRCFKTEEGVLTLAGAAFRATGRLSVTGEITVRFVKPVPLETPLLGRGRLAARHDHDSDVDVEGVIEELGNADVLARARGRFFFSDLSARTVGANSGA